MAPLHKLATAFLSWGLQTFHIRFVICICNKRDCTFILSVSLTQLDDAVLRRLSKRVYVPLPDHAAREAMFSQLLPPSGEVRSSLSKADRADLVQRTEGYSCSDLSALCKEAAMGPVREVLSSGGGESLVRASAETVRPVSVRDFTDALRRIRPSVSAESLSHFSDWEKEHGS